VFSVLIALGSNRGDRMRWLRAGVDALRGVVDVARISSVYETTPVNAPPPNFLNVVVAGATSKSADVLLRELLAVEQRMHRTRGARNAPRTLDLDLIFHSAHVMQSKDLTLPHPRYRDREFVLAPLRELALPWVDPKTQLHVHDLVAEGFVQRIARLW
jgi:2-amino-4-hydroxy-6-hydroxymethyldihydropteridine diphosphokinase